METKNLTTSERISEMLKYALVNGIINNKGEFANYLGIAPATLSRYLSGEKTPPESTLRRFNELFNNVFNEQWLLLGNGEMLIAGRENYMKNTGHIRENANVQTGNNNQIGIPPKKFESEKEWFALVAEKDKQIDRLLTIIETITNNSK